MMLLVACALLTSGCSDSESGYAYDPYATPGYTDPYATPGVGYVDPYATPGTGLFITPGVSKPLEDWEQQVVDN